MNEEIEFCKLGCGCVIGTKDVSEESMYGWWDIILCSDHQDRRIYTPTKKEKMRLCGVSLKNSGIKISKIEVAILKLQEYK